MFWNKKKVRLVEFVKTVELRTDGYSTLYTTRLNGSYVTGSVSSIKEDAEKFFDKFIEMNGVHIVNEVLKQSNL